MMTYMANIILSSYKKSYTGFQFTCLHSTLVHFKGLNQGRVHLVFASTWQTVTRKSHHGRKQLQTFSIE